MTSGEIYLNIIEPECNDHNVYNMFGNKLSTPVNTGFKSYIVFKGGNVIKYWTLSAYMQKRHGVDVQNIEDLLKYKVGENSFDEYSDYDFQLYVCASASIYDMAAYKILLKHITHKIASLRNIITKKIITLPFKTLVKEYINGDDLAKLITAEEQRVIEQKAKLGVAESGPAESGPAESGPAAEKHLSIATKSKSFILTKYSPKDVPILTLLDMDEDESINLSFNNTIITTKNIDFDLFRLKLNFNYKDMPNFGSEFFDMTILRPNPNDDSRESFCANIDSYSTQISISDSSGEIIKLRLYSIFYIFEDLLNILFTTNMPRNSIFLWSDKKYEKRIIRLGYIGSLYLDEQLNHIIGLIQRINTTTNNNMNMSIIGQYAANIHSTDAFLLELSSICIKFITDYILNFVLISFCMDFIKKINESYTNVNTFIELLYADLKLYINTFLRQHNIPDSVSGNIYAQIIEIFTIYTNEHDVNIQTVRKYIDDGKLFHFLLAVNIIYVNRIFILEDEAWCKINYNNEPVDITIFKQKCFDYFKYFFDYSMGGLDSLTDIFNLLQPSTILSGGKNEPDNALEHPYNLNISTYNLPNMQAQEQPQSLKAQEQMQSLKAQEQMQSLKAQEQTQALKAHAQTQLFAHTQTPSDDAIAKFNLFTKKMTDYAEIGKSHKLYENDTTRQYNMTYGNNPINRVDRVVSPKNISANVLNNEKLFNMIVKKQQNAIDVMLQKN
jgi:hypothetical protein